MADLTTMQEKAAEAGAQAQAASEAVAADHKRLIVENHFRGYDRMLLVEETLTADELAYVNARKAKKKGKETDGCNMDTLAVVCEQMGLKL